MVQKVRVPGSDAIINVPDGVTPDKFDAYIQDFKNNQPDPMMEMAKQLVPNVGITERIVKTMKGQQDPEFADVPDYRGEIANASPQVQATRPNQLPGFQAPGREKIDPALGDTLGGDMLIPDDDGYANYLKNSLGDRFRGMKKDKYGYTLIRFVDQNGQEVERYVNKPGLDTRDVQRGFANSIPYQAVAGPLGKVFQGSGLLNLGARAAVQGSGQAATSLATDVAGNVAGSEQLPDPGRALGAGIGGAAGEGLSTLLSKGYDWIIGRQLVKNGRVTPRGRDIARQNGIDPDQMDAYAARRWANDYKTAQDPQWAHNKAAVEQKGLKGTVGDYTGDVEQQILESNMENRQLGQEAYDEMTRFRKEQGAGIKTATDDFSVDQYGHPREVAAGSGKVVQDAVRDEWRKGKDVVNQAWKDIDPERLRPDEVDRQILGHYYKELEKDSPEAFHRITNIDQKLHPSAYAARDLLENVVSGEAKQGTSKLTGVAGGKALDYDTVRRRLGDLRETAYKSSNKGDYKATQDIMDRYNEFLVTLGQNAGDTSDALKLMGAVDMHAKLMAKFGTTGKASNDPAGKFIQDIIHKDATPESIVSKIMTNAGRSGTYSVPIVKRLKSVLGENSPEWAIIRATAFDQLVSGGKPGTLPAEKVAANARSLLTRNSIYSELFDSKELAKIEDMMAGISRIGKKDLPPKMRSAEMSELQRARKDGIIRYLMRRMGTRDTFQGRPFRAAIWHSLARSGFSTPIYNLKEAGGRRIARDATSGVLPAKNRSRAPFVKGVGAKIGGDYMSDDSGW